MAKVIKLNENDIENLVKKIMNESRRSRKIGSYRARNGKVYPKFIDDENYIYIKVGPHESDLVTIEGDGEVKTSEEVQKEIDEIVNYKSNIRESDRMVAKPNKKGKLKENERPRGGMMFGPKAEIIDGVVNRIGEYGDDYIQALEELNSQFPVTKYKTIESPRRIEVPPGVKVQSTVYPTNESLFDFIKTNGNVEKEWRVVFRNEEDESDEQVVYVMANNRNSAIRNAKEESQLGDDYYVYSEEEVEYGKKY